MFISSLEFSAKMTKVYEFVTISCNGGFITKFDAASATGVHYLKDENVESQKECKSQPILFSLSYKWKRYRCLLNA